MGLFFMSQKLTQKQENFCKVYVETGNASEAYRQAYEAENMKQTTIAVKACELLSDGNVSVRVQELRNEHAVRHNITIDSLIEELEQARQLAFDTGKAAPAVTATMGKAKLLGMDKQVIEHTGANGQPLFTGVVIE